MAISLRVSKDEEELFKKYAKMHNMTVSDLIKESVLRRIEDDLDLETYNEILDLYHQQNRTITLDDLLKRK